MFFSKLLRNIKSKNLTGMSLEKTSPDFIPYACHYSPETILTKNGELLQVIKLEDFHSDRDPREDLRSSIIKNVKGNNFALTIHTVRVNKTVSIPWGEKHKNGFPYQLHTNWRKRKKSQVEYKNEIYITVITRGLNHKINLANFPLNFSFSYIKNKHSKHLQLQHKKLTEVTNNILDDLKHFKSRKLGLDNSNNSELLQLFRSFITLLSDDKKFLLPTKDISTSLVEGYFTSFGFNAFEVLTDKKKRFAAALEVKRYCEVGAYALSLAMQLDMELIITETIDFDRDIKQFKKVEYQRYLFDISKQQNLKKITKLGESENDNERFVNHSINIIPISDTIEKLEESLSSLIKSLSECGLAVFRHDVSLENAFFRMLPGNFAFKILSYLSLISNVAGFAILHALNVGKITCAQWGYAITLFWSIHKTPYFFNFHNYANIGHTTIIGPVNSGKTILQNFILSESKRIGTRVFIIDQSMKSKIFINALNGIYKTLDSNDMNIFHNPFELDNSPNNKSFIQGLMKILDNKKLSPNSLESIYNDIFSLEQRSLENIHKTMSPLGSQIDKFFKDEGLFSFLLEESEKNNFWKNQSIGFDLSKLNTELVIILTFIVLHKIESVLDGTPSIIILDEVWRIEKLFNDHDILNNFLKRMKELNCVVIFTGSDVDAIASSSFTKKLNKMIANQIFLPGNFMSKGATKVFDITKEDLDVIGGLQRHNRNFFLKQGDSSIALRLDISDMIEVSVLSSNKKNIQSMETAMAETNSENANDWLPAFYKKI